MTTADVIAACARTIGLPFLVIGGHAVIFHGYPRNTGDLDLLIRKADKDLWIKGLAPLEYHLHHEQEAFVQFTAPESQEPLDLMLVNDPTFAGMLAAARVADLGGTTVKLPCLDHLLMLKLHVLKHGPAWRRLGDLDDVIRLILANHLDIRTEPWRQRFVRYGTLELYEQVRHAVTGERAPGTDSGA